MYNVMCYYHNIATGMGIIIQRVVLYTTGKRSSSDSSPNIIIISLPQLPRRSVPLRSIPPILVMARIIYYIIPQHISYYYNNNTDFEIQLGDIIIIV